MFFRTVYRFLILVLIVGLALLSPLQAEVLYEGAVPNEYMMGFREGGIDGAIDKVLEVAPELRSYSREEIREAIFGIAQLDEVDHLEHVGVHHIESEDPQYLEIFDLISSIADFFEAVGTIQIEQVPNDSQFSLLWGINGDPEGTEAVDAWDETEGSEDLVVAVIDTGVDYDHPDLQANMWVNPGEIAGNGIDDDGNGFVDDVYGHNAIANSGNPDDDHNHGTHCAGTIAATGNNGIGVIGVAPNVKIMALKFLSASGSGSIINAIENMNYMIDMRNRGVNVRVSSNSWGGGGFYSAMNNAITAAENVGISFIAAAGNSNRNNDSSPHYPSSYTQGGVIAVGSTTSSGSRSGFSNYGITSVDIGAPGSGIRSTVRNGGYSTYNGTSMATPHVSGIAALLFSLDPSLTPAEVKNIIMSNSVEDTANYSNRWVTEARANARLAVLAINNSPPTLQPITDKSWSVTQGLATVSLTANDPDDDPMTCSAKVVGAASDAFWNFNQAYNPFCRGAVTVCEEDIYAADTKRLYGDSGELFELRTNNSLYRTDSGSEVLIGTFPGAYDNPTLLTAPLGPPVSGDVTVSCALPNLTIDWQPGYAGQFGVEVTVTANGSSVKQSFSAEVTTTPPTLSDFSAISTFPGTQFEIPFTVNDEGSYTVTATIANHYSAQAKALDSTHNILGYYSNLDDSLSKNEKWLWSGSSGWLYLEPLEKANGDQFAALYRNDSGALLANLSYHFYENPTLLWAAGNPSTPLPSVSIQGNVLHLDIPTTYEVGSFEVRVSVTDQLYTVTRDFDVTVSNTAPSVQYIMHHTVAPGKAGNIKSYVNVSDVDDQDLTVSATAMNAGDELRGHVTSLDLGIKNSLFYNNAGHEEHYLNSFIEDRFYVLSKEEIACFLRLGTVTGNRLGIYPAWYCEEGAIRDVVLDHPKSLGGKPSVSVTKNNEGTYTLDIDARDTALTRVTLRISDGIMSFYRHIFVTVSNGSPVIKDVSDKFTHPAESLSIPFTVSDPDNQVLTYDLTVSSHEKVAYDLDTQYGFGKHSEGFVYSSLRKEPARLRMRDGECDISINSVSLGTLPEMYCDLPELLYDAKAPTAVASGSLSGTSSLSPTATIDLNGAPSAVVTFTASDGIETSEVSFTVSASTLMERDPESGELVYVKDSDSDGISDAQEAIDNTDKYDRGDFVIPTSGSRYVSYSSMAGAELALRLVNTHEEEAAGGTFTVYSAFGEIEQEGSFTIQSGEENILLIKESSEDAPDTVGFIEIVSEGGALHGTLTLSGDESTHETGRVLTASHLSLPHRDATSLLFSPGRVIAGEFDCFGLSECLSDLYIQNLEESDKNFRVQLFSEEGALAGSVELEVPSLSSSLVDLSSIDILPDYGSYRVIPKDAYSKYLAFSEDSGRDQDGDIRYHHLVPAFSGSGHDREMALSNILEGETSAAFFLNTTNESIQVMLDLYGEDERFIENRSLQLAPFSRVEMEYGDLLQNGEVGFLQVSTLKREALSVGREHSYDDLEAEALETHLRERVVTKRDTAASLTHWSNLIARATNSELGGGKKMEEPLKQHRIEVSKELKDGLWHLTPVLKEKSGEVVMPDEYTLSLGKRKKRRLATLGAGSLGVEFLGLKRGTFQFTLEIIGDNGETEILKSRRIRVKRQLNGKKSSGRCTKRKARRGKCKR